MEEAEEPEETVEVPEVEEPDEKAPVEEGEVGEESEEEIQPEEGEVLEELEIVEAVAEEEEIAEEADVEAEEETVEEELEEEVEEERPEVVDERIYTIPLGRAWVAPRRKRAARAVRLLRGFVERHMKVGVGPEEEGEAERLVISNEVNEKIWSRGIEKPPRRIRVRAAKDVEGTVTVYLAEGD